MEHFDDEIKKLEIQLRRLEVERIKRDNDSNSRKVRQRLTYQIGGTFLKYFQINSLEEAERLAVILKGLYEEYEQIQTMLNSEKKEEEHD